MKAMPVDQLTIGDYAMFRGHRIREFLQDRWWKVTMVEGAHVALIDRHGSTARVRRTERYQHLRAIKWEPGDPKNDQG